MTQIETVVNSRSLTSLSVDVNELQPLMLRHVFIRSPLSDVPENNAILNSLPFFSAGH